MLAANPLTQNIGRSLPFLPTHFQQPKTLRCDFGSRSSYFIGPTGRLNGVFIVAKAV